MSLCLRWIAAARLYRSGGWAVPIVTDGGRCEVGWGWGSGRAMLSVWRACCRTRWDRERLWTMSASLC